MNKAMLIPLVAAASCASSGEPRNNNRELLGPRRAAPQATDVTDTLATYDVRGTPPRSVPMDPTASPAPEPRRGLQPRTAVILVGVVMVVVAGFATTHLTLEALSNITM